MKMSECAEILKKNTPDYFSHNDWMPNSQQMMICSLYLGGISIPVDISEIVGKTDKEVKKLIENRIIDKLKDVMAEIESPRLKGKAMIEALQDNLIIEPLEDFSVINDLGGIILPDRPVSSPQFGIVRFAGPDVVSLKPGDRVVLPSWNDDELEVDGKKYIVLAEMNISVRVS